MPSDRRDLEGLLYIPGEELVRSTIEGDDADWSDTLAYVPSTAVVSRVLRASGREVARFKLPAWLQPSRSRDRSSDGILRGAAAVVGATGLSPAPFVAAALAHLVVLAAIGPWITTQPRVPVVVRPPRVTVVPMTRIVYLQQAPASPPTPEVSATRPRAGQTLYPSVTAPVTSRDSARGAADTTAASNPASEERELQAALDQVFYLARNELKIEPGDASRFDALVRVLSERPLVRLLVVGAGPGSGRLGERSSSARGGAREAESFKRALVAAGIAADRVELRLAPENEQQCAEREPECQAGRSRVRTSAVLPPGGPS